MTAEFPTRVTFEEAEAILDGVAASCRMPIESATISRAFGRILTADVVAPFDLPRFDNSAMDGFAVRGVDLLAGGETILRLVGDQYAGRAGAVRVSPGECVRITTGAPMPEGADTVVIKETVRLEDGRLVVPRAVAIGANRRRAGEDARAGEKVLEAGRELTPAALSLAAALGFADLPIHRRPTIAVFTTGDELKSPGLPLAPGEIYDSNRVLLQTLLAADGFEPVSWPVLPDDPDRIRAALLDAAFSFDVVITCGGVSAGEKDYLPALLAQHGQVYFWKVLMRPGMPLLAGKLGDAQLLCLPGNPVSVFATWLTLGRRFLDQLQGRREARPRQFARLSSPITKSHDRHEFLRGKLHCDTQGQWHVEGNPADGSHRLRALAESNALIVVPGAAATWPAGSVMQVLPLGNY